MTRRRTTLLAAGTLAVGGLLAGCSSDGSPAVLPADAGTEAPGATEAPPATARSHVGIVATASPAVATSPDGIPVLVFHQICPAACAAKDEYGISRSDFERLMRSLRDAGYATLSMADFARAHRGDLAGLPARPILLTFDDGRLDAYVGADDVLAEVGFMATMFVITADVRPTPTFYMSWTQIRDAAASRRWTMQLHAHAGHVNVPVGFDALGAARVAPFYGWRECSPLLDDCRAVESLDVRNARVVADLALGEAWMTSQLGSDYVSHSFAVPFGDYGQHDRIDPGVASASRALLDARFEVWFTQPGGDPAFMKPSTTTHEVGRYEVLETTTPEDVQAWLVRHSPSSPPTFAAR